MIDGLAFISRHRPGKGLEYCQEAFPRQHGCYLGLRPAHLRPARPVLPRSIQVRTAERVMTEIRAGSRPRFAIGSSLLVLLTLGLATGPIPQVQAGHLGNACSNFALLGGGPIGCNFPLTCLSQTSHEGFCKWRLSGECSATVFVTCRMNWWNVQGSGGTLCGEIDVFASCTVGPELLAQSAGSSGGVGCSVEGGPLAFVRCEALAV